MASMVFFIINEGMAMLTENLIRVEHLIRQRTIHGLIKTGKDDYKNGFRCRVGTDCPSRYWD